GWDDLHHAAHATHTPHATHIGHGRLVFRQFGNHRLGGDHQAGNRRSGLQRATGDLGRIQDTHLDHVAVLTSGSVVAVVAFAGTNGLQHDSGFFASVGHDLAQRRFDGATQQLDTNVLVFVVTGQVFEGRQGAYQGYTTARYCAFFHSGASSVQRVFYAVLLLFHCHFGSGADLDDRNTASQLGQTLLQFFLVVVGRGFFNLLADLGNTRFDISLGTSTVDHGGVVLVDLHALGLTQVFQASGFQAHADFFADHGTAGEDGDVLQHGLATVTEARRLDGNNLDDTAHVVDYQGSQRFAFNVFGNDHQRTTGLGDSFQHRQHFADV